MSASNHADVKPHIWDEKKLHTCCPSYAVADSCHRVMPPVFVLMLLFLRVGSRHSRVHITPTY